ncbi:hypothetical protein [Actinophytocola sediminis]
MHEQPGEQPSRVTHVGTARALVLLAAVLSGGAALLVCVAALVLGPAILDRPELSGALALGGVTFVVVVALFAVVASVLAARGRTVGTVVVRGCGLLLAGMLIGVASMLLLITHFG